mgnify:FL=1|tara:strand:- start:182 stop:445 length:264 start_codon:yes stop_codon:yes gene_type:complete
MFNLRAIKPEEAIENFINKQTNKVKQRIRNRAIKNAEKTLILAGRKLHDLTSEEWEFIVAEEEILVWERYKKGGLISLIGLAFFGTP